MFYGPARTLARCERRGDGWVPEPPGYASEVFVESVIRYLPATEDQLEERRIQQQEDEVTKLLEKYCSQEWPQRPQLPGPFKPYWPEQNEVTAQQGLLMK